MSGMKLDLSGKHALVCGASRGIGRAAAAALADAGARVTLLARDPDALERACAGCAGTGHAVVSADLADPDGARRTIRTA